MTQRLQLFKRMTGQTYESKIKMSEQIIKEGLSKGPSCVLFSGGKDSTVLLSMVLKQRPDTLVMYNNTGLASPDTVKFIRQYTRGLQYIETQAENAFDVWSRTGYFPILGKRTFTATKKQLPSARISPVQCCYQLKEKPCNQVLKTKGINVVLWGNRATESNRRKMSFCDNGFLFKPVKYAWYQCYPLQFWEDKDIYRYLQENVPAYPIHANFESGCYCCCTDITRFPNNITRLYQNDRPAFDKIIRAGFGREILRIKREPCETEDVEKQLQEKPQIFLRI